MITTLILNRVFLIKAGDKQGSGFAISYSGQRYIITAKHIFDGHTLNNVAIYFDHRWNTVSTEIHVAPHPFDLAYMPAPGSDPQSDPVSTDGNFFISQDVYMVGYPLGKFLDVPAFGGNLPTPLVAKGCIAGAPAANGALDGIFIAGQVDEGFSGGPVVVVEDVNKPRIVGVIIRNLRKRGVLTFEGGKELLVSEAGNLIECHHIQLVKRLIDGQLR